MMTRNVIDLQRVLEEEDCTKPSIEIFREKLSGFSPGEEILIVTSSADAWFAIRNMGDKFGYEVLRYWKESPTSYKVLVRKL